MLLMLAGYLMRLHPHAAGRRILSATTIKARIPGRYGEAVILAIVLLVYYTGALVAIVCCRVSGIRRLYK